MTCALSPLMAEREQASRQFPHDTQRRPFHIISRSPSCDSGLQHHRQRPGHPLKKIVVLMPGPSCVEKREILKILPVAFTQTLPKIIMNHMEPMVSPINLILAVFMILSMRPPPNVRASIHSRTSAEN
jgi:hypothetical protein